VSLFYLQYFDFVRMSTLALGGHSGGARGTIGGHAGLRDSGFSWVGKGDEFRFACLYLPGCNLVKQRAGLHRESKSWMSMSFPPFSHARVTAFTGRCML
jgi:hypothetical protein